LYKVIPWDGEGSEKLLKLPKGHFSVSQFGLFNICSMKYKYKYDESESDTTSSNQALGSFVHKILECLMIEYRDHEYTIPEAGFINERFKHYADKYLESVTYFTAGMSPETFIGEARELVDLYVLERLGDLRPRLVEHKILAVFEGQNPAGEIVSAPILGYADIIDRDILAEKAFGIDPYATTIQPTDIIRDIKVVGKNKGKNEVHKSAQLSLYCAATGTNKAGFEICRRRNSKGEVAVIPHPNVQVEGVDYSLRSRGELNWCVQVFIETAWQVSQKMFRRTNPENWMCSEKWCHFYNDCHDTISTGLKAHKWLEDKDFGISEEPGDR